QLAARQMHPAELRPAFEEETHLVWSHLVDALFLPDVTHFAAEVAVVGGDKSHLVRQLRRTHVGAQDRAGETKLASEHQLAVTAGPERRRFPIRCARSCSDLSRRDS